MKKIISALAALAVGLGLAVVAAPLAASATVGEVGELLPWSAATNQASYWEDYGPHDNAECYKHDGNSDHGSITNGGKTVTLNNFNQAWPGDHWELLVIKGGNQFNNVITHPQAGVAYASPDNNGGQQSNVSHWIVCKGTTPPPPTPTAQIAQPTAVAGIEQCVDGVSVDANGTITLPPFTGGHWNDYGQDANGQLFNVPPGDYTFEAVADAGYKLAPVDGVNESQWGLRFVMVPASVDTNCEPTLPEPKVVVTYGEFGGADPVCDIEDTEADESTVTWTRTKTTTTTPYKVIEVDGQYQVVEDTANATTVTVTDDVTEVHTYQGDCTPPVIEPCQANLFEGYEDRGGLWEVTYGTQHTDTNGVAVFTNDSYGGLVAFNGGAIPDYMGEPGDAYRWLYVYGDTPDKVYTFDFADGTRVTATVTYSEESCPQINWDYGKTPIEEPPVETPTPAPVPPTLAYTGVNEAAFGVWAGAGVLVVIGGIAALIFAYRRRTN